LARPEDPERWKRLDADEYREALLAVVLGVDRRTAAGRRTLRRRMREIAERKAAAEGAGVAESEGGARRGALFRPEGRERWLAANKAKVAAALEGFSPDPRTGEIALVREIERCKSRRDAVALVRKQTGLLGGLRAFEFLEEIGYPIAVPDPARRRLFDRLGWTEPKRREAFPAEFFDLFERLVRLTGEPWRVVNAAVGLFAGSRDVAPGSSAAESLAVCGRRPQCGRCVLASACAFYRYRGEPAAENPRSVKRMAYAEQPRTRFEALGPANLSEAELLALILRTGAEGMSSLDLAREILERFGSLEALSRAGLGELRRIRGIGRAKAIEIKAALELGRRLLGGPVAVGETIRRSADVFAIYRGLLEHEQQENFYLVVLNARNRIQSHFLISRGSLTSSPVHPRDVIKVAIREAAASVIFVHNHPSGEPEPSDDDIAITERLAQAARLVGIRVLDHVIIGRDNYFSFADHHLLDPEE